MAISRLSKGNPPSGVYLATREFLYSVLCAGYALLDLTGGKKGGLRTESRLETGENRD